ncbi:hypothetical protein [Algoriphagus confluentis]|uniref:Uncharacterized protein n=1 Tax=Algoriphagus confluentis TaxID=1697556 RepID=A0ABQ6PLH7_9BACT|nr:hypothetical protein Aconfl_07780 [Algoriphagus confluentis]
MKSLVQFLIRISLVFFPCFSWGQEVTFTPFGTSPFWFGEQTTFALGYRVGSSSVVTPICATSSASVVGNSGAVVSITPGMDALTVTWGGARTIGPQHAKVNLQLGTCNYSI